MAQTPSTTNYAEIQENEVQVLQSIFMEDFIEEEAKAGAWNVGQGLLEDTSFNMITTRRLLEMIGAIMKLYTYWSFIHRIVAS